MHQSPSVGHSISRFIIFVKFYGFTSRAQPECLNGLLYHCFCPPASLVFNHVLCDSISHFLVCPLVGWLVGWLFGQSHLLVFAFFTSLLLPKSLNVLLHHCPCPPATKIALFPAFFFLFFFCSSKPLTQENLEVF